MGIPEIVAELHEDMNVAIRQLRASSQPGDQRRAFRLALATLYTWRNTVRPDGVLYSEVDGGQILEHLIELRGLYEHQLLRSKGLSAVASADLVPGEDVLPAEDRYLWEVVIRDDLETSGWGDKKGTKRAAYEALRGRIASDVLQDATDFLAQETS